MSEKKNQAEFKYMEDPKKLDRRLKNREAVQKHREKEAIEEKRRQRKEQKLRLENARLEGEIQQMQITRKLLKELLVDRLRRKGQQLTPQQIKFLEDDDDEDESFGMNQVGIIAQQMTHLTC
ncbi:hypothetical protein ACKWTF_001381 [Chironomus riparius]